MLDPIPCLNLVSTLGSTSYTSYISGIGLRRSIGHQEDYTKGKIFPLVSGRPLPLPAVWQGIGLVYKTELLKRPKPEYFLHVNKFISQWLI